MITALFDVADDAADARARLASSLASLVPAVIEGLVSDAIVRDISQSKAIRDVADRAGAMAVDAKKLQAPGERSEESVKSSHESRSRIASDQDGLRHHSWRWHPAPSHQH